MEVSFAKPSAETQPEKIITQVETPVEGVTVESVTSFGPEAFNGGPDPRPLRTTPFAVAARPAMPVSTPFAIGEFIPEFSDIVIPRINIVQKVGELSNVYPHGSILYNQNLVLYTCPTVDKDGKIVKPGDAPLELVCLGFKPKRFVERVEGGGRGQICNSEAEVVKVGGTTNYQEAALKADEGIRYFQPLADALVLLFKPDSIPDDGATFNFDVDGRKAVLALWAMKGGSYTKGAKTIYTAKQMGCLRAGYFTHTWNFTTRLEKYSTGNFAYVPILTPRVKSSEAILEFAKQVLAGN